MKIYYVEDEKDFSDLMKIYLENEGYSVLTFYTGDDALKHIKDEVDLWILDINLPGKTNGFDLLEKIKVQTPEVPCLITSARDEDLDIISGLEKGSEDYICKPFSPKEFLLRINNIMRRKKQPNVNVYDYENYEINVSKRYVKEDDTIIELTYKEFELLIFLLKNQGKIIKREEIINKIWGQDQLDNTRIVDDLLRRLRKKMKNLRVETVYGSGYRIF